MILTRILSIALLLISWLLSGCKSSAVTSSVRTEGQALRQRAQVYVTANDSILPQNNGRLDLVQTLESESFEELARVVFAAEEGWDRTRTVLAEEVVLARHER